ncbi:MAG: NAD-dependent epimerase/dehydratase [Proteobacteria bacterium]|nr:NAD-dependent epimerase/dehydratase [Pseudomonadota bacterium]
MSESYKILVTGGAGYLGSVMVPLFLHAGHSVTVLDNFMYSQTGLAGVCHHPRFDVVKGDARLEETLEPLLKDADIVIPLAGLVGAPLCDKHPEDATNTNLEAVRMLVGLLAKDQKVLLPNTNSGYGIGESGKLCTEETPLKPITLYGRDKVAAETAVLEHGNALSFRLATVFGMSPRPRIDLLVNDFVYQAVTEGRLVLFESHFKRNFIHIRDVARAFLHAFDNFETMKGGPYNVGLSDANLSKKELCEKIQEHVPGFTFEEDAIGEDPDKRDYIVSNQRLREAGFEASRSINMGISELVKGFSMMPRGIFKNC